MFLLEGTHRTLKRTSQTQNTLNVHTVDWQRNFFGLDTLSNRCANCVFTSREHGVGGKDTVKYVYMLHSIGFLTVVSVSPKFLARFHEQHDDI